MTGTRWGKTIATTMLAAIAGAVLVVFLQVFMGRALANILPKANMPTLMSVAALVCGIAGFALTMGGEVLDSRRLAANAALATKLGMSFDSVTTQIECSPTILPALCSGRASGWHQWMRGEYRGRRIEVVDVEYEIDKGEPGLERYRQTVIIWRLPEHTLLRYCVHARNWQIATLRAFFGMSNALRVVCRESFQGDAFIVNEFHRRFAISGDSTSEPAGRNEMLCRMLSPEVMKNLLAMSPIHLVAGDDCLAFYRPRRTLIGDAREQAIRQTFLISESIWAGLSSAVPHHTHVVDDDFVDPGGQLLAIGCAVVGMFAGFLAGTIAFAVISFSQRGPVPFSGWRMPLIVVGSSAVGSGLGWLTGWLLQRVRMG